MADESPEIPPHRPKLVVVDVEADGPYVGDYSMVCFGAVVVEPGLTRTYYGKCSPISEKWVPAALKVSGFTRAQHEKFQIPQATMPEFRDWLHSLGNVVFISDNPAFDWQWINFYLHRYAGMNPFGHSARRIGDVWSGLMRDMGKSSQWKKFRRTKHSHDPVDDARGNAEALLTMQKLHGLLL